MKCLYCGDCCLRMSPFGAPCPKLDKHGTFYFCSNYGERPNVCSDHCHPFGICPIGIDKLAIKNKDEIHKRIDTGYALLKYDVNEESEAYRLLINEKV